MDSVINNKRVVLVGLGVVVVAIVMGVVGAKLGQTEKITERKSEVKKVQLSVAPTKDLIKTGDLVETDLWMDSQETLIAGMKVDLMADGGMIEKVEVNKQEFDSVVKESIEEEGRRVKLIALAMKSSEKLPRGKVRLAKLWLRATDKGSVGFNLGETSEAIGDGKKENLGKILVEMKRETFNINK